MSCEQDVVGSNPTSSTIWPIRLDGSGHEAFNLVAAGSSPLSVTAELSAIQFKTMGLMETGTPGVPDAGVV